MTLEHLPGGCGSLRYGDFPDRRGRTVMIRTCRFSRREAPLILAFQRLASDYRS
jgi:hypothetical protein